MQLHVTMSQLKLAPELETDVREYLDKRLGSLARFFKRLETDSEIQIYVELSRPVKHHEHGKIYYAEVTMQLPGRTLRAEAYAETVTSSIDQVKDTLKHELAKYKGTRFLRNVRKNKKLAQTRKRGV
jgi:ribosomal subunit interface protein